MARIALGIGLIGLLASWAAAGPMPHHYPKQQHGPHHQTHHQSHHRTAVYDPQTEITLSGVVDRIWTEDCLGCGCQGAMHFTFEADGGTHEAHLGPTSYLAEKGWDVMRGDRIEVKGAVLPHRGGGKALVVREMKRGGETLVLRDEAGIPVWTVRPCW